MFSAITKINFIRVNAPLYIETRTPIHFHLTSSLIFQISLDNILADNLCTLEKLTGIDLLLKTNYQGMDIHAV